MNSWKKGVRACSAEFSKDKFKWKGKKIQTMFFKAIQAVSQRLGLTEKKKKKLESRGSCQESGKKKINNSKGHDSNY